MLLAIMAIICLMSNASCCCLSRSFSSILASSSNRRSSMRANLSSDSLCDRSSSSTTFRTVFIAVSLFVIFLFFAGGHVGVLGRVSEGDLLLKLAEPASPGPWLANSLCISGVSEWPSADSVQDSSSAPSSS